MMIGRGRREEEEGRWSVGQLREWEKGRINGGRQSRQ